MTQNQKQTADGKKITTHYYIPSLIQITRLWEREIRERERDREKGRERKKERRAGFCK